MAQYYLTSRQQRLGSSEKYKRNNVHCLISYNDNFSNSSLNNDGILLHDVSSHANSISNLINLCGNGSCESNLLNQLKFNFGAWDYSVSTSGKRISGCVVPSGKKYVDSNSVNVIYLMTGNRCYSHHVSETV